MIGIEIFNLMGQKMFEIPEENHDSGTYPVIINLSALKSGVYCYKVNSDDESLTRKMIVE